MVIVGDWRPARPQSDRKLCRGRAAGSVGALGVSGIAAVLGWAIHNSDSVCYFGSSFFVLVLVTNFSF